MRIARAVAAVCTLAVAAVVSAAERITYVIYTADGTRAGKQVTDHTDVSVRGAD